MAKNEDDQLWSMESKLTITRRTISSLHNCKLRSQWWRTDTSLQMINSLYFFQMIPMKYLHCYFDPMFARWRRINSRVDWQQAIRMRMKWSGRSWNLLIIFLVLIDGIKVYNYNQYMEMSLADLELCPWLHLDRGAKNKEKWEEWLSLWTLLECSGILWGDNVWWFNSQK